MFPKQWYVQRARSESHASSDLDQYQDASDCLNVEMNSLSLSPPPPHFMASAAAYLDMVPGSSHNHTPATTGYLELLPSSILSPAPGPTDTAHLGPDSSLGPAPGLVATELSQDSSLGSAPGLIATELSQDSPLGSSPSFYLDCVTTNTNEVIVVAQDMEMSRDDVGKSHDVLADQSEISENKVEEKQR